MWFRPILTISAQSTALALIESRRAVIAGIRWLFVLVAAAMCIAEGNVSFEDCDMLTWSFGWIGRLLPSGVPASWQHRFDTTSLTFILNCVPLPVIQTCTGNIS